MNRTANDWAAVKVDAVFGGSETQARNVLKMALEDLAQYAAARSRVEANLERRIALYRDRGGDRAWDCAQAIDEALEAIRAIHRGAASGGRGKCALAKATS